MTDPTASPGATRPRHDPAAGVSLLARLQLTEPVRLWLYSVGMLVLGALVLAGVLSGEWHAFGSAALLTLLGLPLGTEAARAAVYSPATVARELVRRTIR